MKRTVLRVIGALAILVGLGAGLSAGAAGASTHFATGLNVPAHVSWLPQTAAGVTYTTTGDFVRLPSLRWYSTHETFVYPGYASQPIGPTPRGMDFCVGYTHYGCVWTNYNPYTGQVAQVVRQKDGNLYVISPV